MADQPQAAPSTQDDVRKLFLAASEKPRRVETVTVPDFGKVHVKGLTAAEYDRFEAGCVVDDGDGKMTRQANRALMVRLCVVTADGKKVFRDDHVEMLEGLDSSIINPIAAKAMELCGLGPKATEDIEKN